MNPPLSHPILCSVDQEGTTRWRRPPLPAINLSADRIEFQCLDVDYAITDTSTVIPSKSKLQREPRSAVVRLYGVNDQGNSVMVHVHNFEPYFYVNAWTESLQQHDLIDFGQALNQALLGQIRGQEIKNIRQAVKDVQVVQDRRSVWGYRSQSQVFLKITVALPSFVATARRLVEKGLQMGSRSLPALSTYESNIPFVLRFMVDRKISGGSWVSLPAGTYKVRASAKTLKQSTVTPAGLEPISHCQLECDVDYSDVVAHAPEGVYQRLAPIRVLSFDIECQGRHGVFPTAEEDPVIQIANVLQIAGQQRPLLKQVFTLGTCAPIAEAVVVASDTESKMLEAWRKFFVECDADVIIGYNINNFDFPYLLDRAQVCVILGAILSLIKCISTCPWYRILARTRCDTSDVFVGIRRCTSHRNSRAKRTASESTTRSSATAESSLI